jgi:drug/metabolite transporter (DMT)-like permease
MPLQTDAPRIGFTNHEKGVALIVISTLAWSGSGVYSRLLTTDPLTAIALRSLFGGLALLLPSFFLEGGWSRRQWCSVLHPSGLAMIALNVISQASFIGALYLTSVANVAVIYATAPFIAALLGWLMLRQRVGARTMLAGGVCLLGVAIIVGTSFGGHNGLGNLLALVMTVSFAMIIVVPRMNPGIAILPPTIVSAFLSALLFSPFASYGTTALHDWLVLAAFGATNFSFAFVIFMAGARHVPPAEAALILTLETVLTPTWVWLFFGETPPTATLLGGGVILAAVVWHTMADVRRSRARR